ncbi:Uncharacterized protein AXF42_Ash003074 [Apostasia shenzhenica]|uniref:MORF/ORRM1/DAG-like MORF domain-containing protein n=1 Tax=Apostasia shenzhenica TaxID=1088818 RepID=A0A2I0A848_9ASPA|nr:Uncharacterized protein AXF42_Ash003074 [Apostasia shenzhenica]
MAAMRSLFRCNTFSSIGFRFFSSRSLSFPRLSPVVSARPLVSVAEGLRIMVEARGASSRCFSTRSTTSSLNDPSPNWSNRPPKETILLDGCDFEHWLVVVEKPDESLTRDEIIDSYIKTLAQVVGSEEEARMKIYSVSTKHYFAFGALVSEELSYKIKALPGVRWVLPDSYLDVKNKDYGGEPFINGQAVPYDPKYHEEWVRNNARANERSRRQDRPRNFDRSRRMQNREYQNRDAPPMPNFQMSAAPTQPPQASQPPVPPSPNSSPNQNPNPQPGYGYQSGPPGGQVYQASPPGSQGYQAGPQGGQGYQAGPQGGGQGYQAGPPGGGQGYQAGPPGGQGYQAGPPGGQGYQAGPPGGQGYQAGPQGGQGYQAGPPGGQGYRPGPTSPQGYQAGPPGPQGYQSGPPGPQGYQSGQPSNYGYQVSQPGSSPPHQGYNQAVQGSPSGSPTFQGIPVHQNSPSGSNPSGGNPAYYQGGGNGGFQGGPPGPGAGAFQEGNPTYQARDVPGRD